MGAYMGDRLVGVFLTDMQNEPKIFTSLWSKLYVKIISFIINLGYKNASATYDNTNVKMLEDYKKNMIPMENLTFLQ